MPATIAGSHLGLDTHANRPAANAAGQPIGAVYSCSTHGLIYKTDGSSWATWAPLGSTPSGSITASGYTQSTAKMLGRSTASAGAIEEIAVGTGLTLSGGTLSATGGGGAVGQAYLGYNTVGGSTETGTFTQAYLKTFTTSGACLLVDIELYWKELADSLQVFRVGLWADNAGAPGDLIASGITPTLAPTSASGFTSNARWMATPLSAWLAASTAYWIGFQFSTSGGASFQLYYDAGSDQKWTSGGDFLVDGGRYTASSTSRKYSLRANTVS